MKNKILLFFLFLLIQVNSFPITNQLVIIFNTLPKSGSIYIGETLSKGLNVPFQSISNGYFPKDLINIDQLKKAVSTGGILQDHFDPSPHNIQILKAMNCKKIIVNIRDPRQSLLSFVHHLNNIKDNKLLLLRLCPVPPEEYYSWSLHDQIDWNIDNYLPLCIEWIQKWVFAKNNEQNLTIKFTFYEDFIKNKVKFINDILEFYSIPLKKYKHMSLPLTPSYHFRKGEKDEWRYIFTPRQQERITCLIPPEFFELFPWIP